MIHLVGHITELERPDAYLRHVLPRSSDIVVQRRTNSDGSRGGLWAFSNICPHRGARILDGWGGCAKPVCPYHGRIARPENTPEQYGVIQAGGWVFVESMPMRPARLPDLMAAFTLSTIARNSEDVYLARSYRRPMACTWAQAIENTLDWTHIGAVHSDSLARMQLRPAGGMKGECGTSMESFASTPASRLWRLTRRLHSESTIHEYTHAYITPYACLTSTCLLAFTLQTYMPTADGVDFLTRLYMPLGLRGADQIAGEIMAMNRQVFDEDAAVCERLTQTAMAPPTDAEWRIAHFRAHGDAE